MNNRKLRTLGIGLALWMGFGSMAFASTSGKICKDKVNLRKSASTDADVLVVLAKGEAVQIESSKGDWFKVVVGKNAGYVRSDMIEKEQAATASQDAKAGTLEQSAGAVEKSAGAAEQSAELAAPPSELSASMTNLQSEEMAEANATKIAGDKMLVGEAQEILKALHFYYKEVDGSMGTASLSALKSFQRAYNLSTDGKLGRETILALREASASGGNGSSAEKVSVSENGVILAEWFNAMKYKVPKYEHLRVVDVDTGVEFKLRAFSLGNHADVEPPTKEDTQILYRINGNKWTWTPRAIWVYIDGQAYAAAINVKPHGPDTLPDNGMSGQICMHFLHSRQHNTGQENKNLQAAVLKAYENAAKAPAANEPGKTLESGTTIPEGPLSTLSVEEMMALVDEEE